MQYSQYQPRVNDNALATRYAALVSTATRIGGVLTPHHLANIALRLNTLTPSGGQELCRIVDGMRSAYAEEFVWKALSGGNDIETLRMFANAISGMADSWLFTHLTLINSNIYYGGAVYSDQRGDSGQLAQQWCDSCAATVEEALRGSEDPCYAYWLHLGGPIDVRHGMIHSPADEVNVRLSEDQALILSRYGGVPKFDKRQGGSGLSMSEILQATNDLFPTTNVFYVLASVDPRDTRALVRHVEILQQALAYGIPCPIGVGDESALRHAVLGLDARGDEILVYDPGKAQTGWIATSQFVNGTLAHFASERPDAEGSGAGGWDILHNIIYPNPQGV